MWDFGDAELVGIGIQGPTTKIKRRTVKGNTARRVPLFPCCEENCSMAKYKEQNVSQIDLLFDPNNYRFQDTHDFASAEESRFHESKVQHKAYRNLRDQSLLQLKNSILRNGLLPFEKLLVRTYKKDKTKFVVAEGNRRLAAIRWIVEDNEAGVNIPKPVLDSFEEIPVFILEDDRGDPVFQEAVLGVRHVSGIKQWGGYQRAKLVVSMRDEFNLDTAEVAGRLAMSSLEVNRRYRAFKTLEQMQDHEEYGQYAQADMYPIFHEAVAQPNVRDWLGWNDDTSEFEDETELEHFYKLITSEESEDGDSAEPKIRTYADVRDLKLILENEEARTTLLDPSRTLSDALAIAKGPELRRSWKRQVSTAIEALGRIGVPELKALKKDELAEIKKLRDAADELLTGHKKLTKK